MSCPSATREPATHHSAPVDLLRQASQTGARLVVALLLLASTLSAQPTQLSVPDTTPAPKAAPPVQEPERRPRRLARDQRVIAIQYGGEEGVDHFRASVPELVAFANAETDLEGIRFVGDAMRLSDARLGRPLVLVLTGNRTALPFSAREKVWLGGYLTTGGLLYAEDVRPPTTQRSDVARSGTPFDRQIKALLADGRVLGEDGELWQPVPKDHPLFRAYFEFPDGPPLTQSSGGIGRAAARVTQLEMLEVRGRVVALFSDLNISWGWSSIESTGRRRALQFGTNILVFAVAERSARR